MKKYIIFSITFIILTFNFFINNVLAFNSQLDSVQIDTTTAVFDSTDTTIVKSRGKKIPGGKKISDGFKKVEKFLDVVEKRGTVISDTLGFRVGGVKLWNWGKVNKMWTKLLLKAKYQTSLDDYIRYNRVEGLFLGFGGNTEIRNEPRPPVLEMGIGYGLKSKEWRYYLGLKKPFFLINPLMLDISIYDLTDTDSPDAIGTLENSLSTLLFKEDFRDYFEREGVTFLVSQNIGIKHCFILSHKNDIYKNMYKVTNWTLSDLIDRGISLKDNPTFGDTLQPGRMMSVVLGYEFDTRDDIEKPVSGWLNKIEFEISNRRIESDYTFSRVLINIIKYNSLGDGQFLDFRIKFGSVFNYKDNLPFPKFFYLGSIGSLPGYKFKEFSGDNMFIVNLEYKINIYEYPIQVVFLTDIGNAWKHDSKKSILQSWISPGLTQFKPELGFALQLPNGKLRIEAVKRIDDYGIDLPIKVIARIERTF